MKNTIDKSGQNDTPAKSKFRLKEDMFGLKEGTMVDYDKSADMYYYEFKFPGEGGETESADGNFKVSYYERVSFGGSGVDDVVEPYEPSKVASSDEGDEPTETAESTSDSDSTEDLGKKSSEETVTDDSNTSGETAEQTVESKDPTLWSEADLYLHCSMCNTDTKLGHIEEDMSIFLPLKSDSHMTLVCPHCGAAMGLFFKGEDKDVILKDKTGENDETS